MPIPKFGPGALEVLSILSAPTNDGGMTSASIYARCSHAKSMTQVTQTLGNLLIKEPALVRRQDSGPSRATWIITPAGIERLHAGETEQAEKPARAKKQTKRATAKRTKALAEPGIDPGHTDPEAEEEGEDEEEIDFALWHSGVLAIQIGEDTFGVPAKHVGALRDYLNKHLPRPFLLGLGCGNITRKDAILEIVGFPNTSNKPHKFADFLNDQVRNRLNGAPPAPPIPPAAYASAEPVVSAAPPPAPPPETISNDRPVATALTSDPGRPVVSCGTLTDLPWSPTEPVGLSGVELDGPNGIQVPGTSAALQADAALGASLLNDHVVSHGMTRSEQFAEAAGRG